MAMKRKMLTAVFRDRAAASETYNWLLHRGFAPDQINVLMSDRTRSAFDSEGEEGEIKAGTKTTEGLAAGGAIGTVVGAGAAAIAAIGGFILIPGIGWVAGPLVAALAGGGAGAVAGGAIGTLIGLGISESNASAYEEALRNGGVVLGVVPRTSEDATLIQKHFEEQHADNVVFA